MIKFISRENHGNDVVLHKTDSNTCTDVVRTFYYFLLGVSFNKGSILEAFDTIVQEYGGYEHDKLEE